MIICDICDALMRRNAVIMIIDYHRHNYNCDSSMLHLCFIFLHSYSANCFSACRNIPMAEYSGKALRVLMLISHLTHLPFYVSVSHSLFLPFLFVHLFSTAQSAICSRHASCLYCLATPCLHVSRLGNSLILREFRSTRATRPFTCLVSTWLLFFLCMNTSHFCLRPQRIFLLYL